MTILYGISNCDTVKKARLWLDQRAVPYRFHDLRRDGLTPAHLQNWLAAVAWEKLVNKRSTTWKQLDSIAKQQLDASTVVATLLAHPTLIKRPVVERDGALMVGFNADDYGTFFRNCGAQTD